MQEHNAWLRQGFDDDVFLLAGSLKPDPDGCKVADNTSRNDLEKRVSDDPFILENMVQPEIIEIAPARADERLQFLVSQS